MNFSEIIKKEKEYFEKEMKFFIEEKIKKTPKELSKLLEAMNYTLESGGKRLRPVILLKTYELFGGTDKKTALKFALAMEFIHNYSLVHDDLPAMDNDDYRRGKKTNHKVYGEAIAILVGDALLNLAYETIFSAFSENSSIRLSKAAKLIAEASGFSGMVGGQALEIFDENPSESVNLLILKLKTSKLFVASILSGAILAGIKDDELEYLKGFSEKIGIAFQIKDDILDMGEEKSNAENFKSTSDLYGKENATILAQKLIDESQDYLGKINSIDTLFYKELSQYMLDRKK